MSKSSTASHLDSINDVINLLPASTRRKLNITDLKMLSGALLVKDRIEAYYHNVYRSEQALRQWKRSQGYCGGRPHCMVWTGEHQHTCDACRAENKKIRHGDGRINEHTEYGKIRLREKSAERDKKLKEQPK